MKLLNIDILIFKKINLHSSYNSYYTVYKDSCQVASIHHYGNFKNWFLNFYNQHLLSIESINRLRNIVKILNENSYVSLPDIEDF